MIEFIAGCMAGIAIAKKVRAIAEWKPEIQNLFKDKIEIVKFSEDKFAIRKKDWLGSCLYYGITDGSDHWWSVSLLSKYGLGTLEECKGKLLMARAELMSGVPIKD